MSENYVLVGFGKYILIDMLDWRGTDKEEDLLKAIEKWPPVYRRQTICSEEELLAHLEYANWLNTLIKEFSEEKENV